MPEVLEVELYRRLAETTVGRRVTGVVDTDPIVMSSAGDFQSMIGCTIDGVHRHGKVLSLVISQHSHVVNLHFGMTGRLIVDGQAALESLVYGASDNDRWIRFGLRFDGGHLMMSDPRRFSRVRWGNIDAPTELGPDVFAVAVDDFVARLELRPRSSLKAVLLDQRVVAGLGNMLVDEILLRAGLDPRCRVESLGRSGLVTVHEVMVEVLPELLARGGSHAGHLASSLRRPGAPCPLDGAPLVKMTVGGRTTFACLEHQHLK